MTKLEEMLKYVSEHNEFYKNRIKEYGIKNPLDITQWPMLTRKELQENRYNLFSDGYKAKYLCHQLKRSTSSGTSGIPINVYWDANDYWKSMMPLWRKRKNWYGITPDDKRVAFTLSHTNIKGTHNSAICLETKNQLLFNAASLSSEKAYNAAILRILSFNPKWIYVQPSILEQLIYYYKKNGFDYPSNLTHIDSVGEILTTQLRTEALNFFNVPISNLYGSEEHNGIAYECPSGNMHILQDNVYVEKDGLITNINNHAFPLIRYDQGDKIKLSDTSKSCCCGYISPYINSIQGRIRESFNIDGININAYLLSEILDIVNNQFNGMINSFSFYYYNRAKLLKCHIMIRPENNNWTKHIMSETEKALLHNLSVCEGLQICVVPKNEIVTTQKKQILTIAE